MVGLEPNIIESLCLSVGQALHTSQDVPSSTQNCPIKKYQRPPKSFARLTRKYSLMTWKKKLILLTVRGEIPIEPSQFCMPCPNSAPFSRGKCFDK